MKRGFLYIILILTALGCQTKHRIYLEKFYNATRSSRGFDDLRFKNISDTAFVKLSYNGDFGIISSAFYNLKENNPDGHYLVYVNGILEKIAAFKGGNKNGKQYTYYHDGNYSISIYENGIINGIGIVYNKNGTIIVRSFFESGNLMATSHYNEKSKEVHNNFYLNNITVRDEIINIRQNSICIKNPLGKAHDRTEAFNTTKTFTQRYLYPKGDFLVTYKNAQMVKCNWIPVMAKSN